jgi:hypothetical protein
MAYSKANVKNSGDKASPFPRDSKSETCQGRSTKRYDTEGRDLEQDITHGTCDGTHSRLKMVIFFVLHGSIRASLTC